MVTFFAVFAMTGRMVMLSGGCVSRQLPTPLSSQKAAHAVAPDPMMATRLSVRSRLSGQN